jgi:hypothetical protein
MLAQMDLDWEYIHRYLSGVPGRVVAFGAGRFEGLLKSAEFRDGSSVCSGRWRMGPSGGAAVD